MKKILWIFVIIIFSQTLFGDMVSVDKAKTVALNWLSNINMQKKNSMQLSILDIYEQRESDAPVYYIINLKPEGFVLVSAEDAVIPVLGYGTSGHLSFDQLPDHIKSFLSTYSDQISAIKAAKTSNTETIKQWNRILDKSIVNDRSDTVAPLLTTEWDQNYPWNGHCPADPNSTLGNTYNGHVPVGCAAVALGQIMKKWNYPDKGYNIDSYIDGTGRPPSYGTMTPDLTTNFNWNAMSVNNSDVSFFLNQVGIAINTDYGNESSSASLNNIVDALNNNYGYTNATIINKQNFYYTPDAWTEVLKEQLIDSMAVYYYGAHDLGTPEAGGHGFVVDGYNYFSSVHYFHINWGWGGRYNSYFTLDNLNPTPTHSYNENQMAIVDIYPANPSSLALTRDLWNIILTWSAPVAGTPESYSVYRNDVLIASGLSASTFSYTDTSAEQGSFYTYSVKANYLGGKQSFATKSSFSFSNLLATLTAVDITSSSATLKANISDYVNNMGYSYGFRMSAVQGFTTPESIIAMGTLFSAGDFNRTTTTLSDNTTYYYRAYITNSTKTLLGNEISFTTPVKNDIPRITSYTVNQRPGNMYYLDIKYYIEDNDDQSFNVSLQVSDDNGLTWDVPVNQAHLSGDIGPGVNATNGTEKHIIWNVGQNLPGIFSNQFRLKVKVDDMHYDSPSAQNMVFVEGGTFQMGATGIETPVHSVTLSSFYIGKYEVTQAEWQSVMTGNTNGISATPSHTSYGIGPDNPVNEVSWYDIMVYSNRKSIQKGLTPCYAKGGDTNPDNWGMVPTSINAVWNAITCNWSANGYRLPTEAEWEFAARGGNQSQGYKYSGSNTIGDVAWYSDNSGSINHPVGTKAPNELGIYDMSGNVWECCWDRYCSYTTSAQTNPTGATSGSYRVHRGGSWGHSGFGCRVAVRGDINPYARSVSYGFRSLRTIR